MKSPFPASRYSYLIAVMLSASDGRDFMLDEISSRQAEKVLHRFFGFRLEI
jgi:hypothetical protein